MGKRIWHGPQWSYVGPSTQQGGAYLTSLLSSRHPAQARGGGTGLRRQAAWVQVLALALTTCVLLGTSLRLSEPVSSCVKVRSVTPALQSSHEDWQWPRA